MMVAINMVGVVRRKYYGLLPFALGNPGYWMLHSFAAYKALWQLITKPFYWEKTNHGQSAAVHDSPVEAETPNEIGPGGEFTPDAGEDVKTRAA
jgi:hypothetical protein